MRSAANYENMSAEEKLAFDEELKQKLGIAKTFSNYGVDGFDAYLANWINNNAYTPPAEPTYPEWPNGFT
jgi:hypothetical protein